MSIRRNTAILPPYDSLRLSVLIMIYWTLNSQEPKRDREIADGKI